MSTSCSFGMMANLSRLELTNSPCAEILAFRPQLAKRYHGAADALQAADKMQQLGKEEEADEIRTEVEKIRNKFVLIELITTDWCPGVWTEAMEQGTTCSAKRFSSTDFGAEEFFIGEDNWAERAEYLVRGIGGETKLALMESRTPKMGLGEDTCDRISDVELDDVLDKVSSPVPPDFFKGATV